MGMQALRRWGAVLGMATTVAVLLGLLLGSAVGSADPTAQAARKTRRFTETANLHLVKKRGAILKESGSATGTLPGTVKARFDTSNIAKVTGTVTFYPRSGGSLTFTAVGYPQSTSKVAKFNGNMAVRSGTGRYASAVGSGTFTGTVNRSSWAMTVNAKATLTY
jgi:hypothetical protein